MMRHAQHIAVTLLVFLFSWNVASALEVPALSRYVTDKAGVMSSSERDDLENLLESYSKSSGSQFVVLIIPSLEGESLEEYSMRVAEKNKIGREGDDNGLLFLVALNDRVMRFEVGYGLEPVLTDALTSVIIRDVIAPRFRDGDFGQGIKAGMQAAIQAASGNFTPPPRAQESPRKKKNSIGGLIVFFIVLFLIMRNGRKGRGGGIWFIGGPWTGGGSGFGGGGGFSGGGGFGGFSGGGGSFGGGGSSGGW